MGGTYAGVLGLIAFQTVLARGLWRSAGVESTLLRASLALFGFALLGYIVGRLALWIVEESVRGRVEEEAAMQKKAVDPKGAAQTGKPAPA